MEFPQSNQYQGSTSAPLRRRDFFSRMGTGVFGAALASLFSSDAPGAGGTTLRHSAARAPHFAPRARSVIQLFMTGGPSHIDLLDPKPALAKYSGHTPRALLDAVESVGKAGGLLPSPFRFSRGGSSGLEISEALPNLAECADDIAVIRSMWTTDFNHESAIYMMHSGRNLKASPAIGAWVAYGLGSENENLPAYVALDDPDNVILLGKQNWQAGWLPPVYQGTRLRTQGSPLINLHASDEYPPDVLRMSRDLLRRVATDHRDQRPNYPELDARLASYELAAKMQLSATDALDIASETAETSKLYGLDRPQTNAYGRRCLMARRLVERGVRFVQIYMNAATANPWDHHASIKGGLESCCGQTDLPVAGLLKDLKQRGLFDTTLVTWGGEFGRLPLAQKGDDPGRDHGSKGFSVWLAGGGVKGGVAYGATDELGYKAVENPVSVHDYHATILHCLGLDHNRLVFDHHGLPERLTGVEGARVVTPILA